MNPRAATLSVSVPAGETPRALCVGLVASDFLVPVSFPLPRDVKVTVDRVIRQGGGPAANAAVALARLGVRSAFVGAVGRDGLGAEQRADLAREGVDVSRVHESTDVPSFPSFILVDRTDGARTIVSAPDERPQLPAGDAGLPEPRPHLLLVDGWAGPAQRAYVTQARALGIPVLLDAGSCRDEVVELIPECEIVIASEPFADAYAGRGEVEAALRKLAAAGPRLVAVTRGARPGLAAVRDVEEAFEFPAFPVEAVDTTGAGDAFHAGAAWALLEGRPWGESLRRAAAVAACKCRKPGARDGLPDREEAHRFLEGRSTA